MAGINTTPSDHLREVISEAFLNNSFDYVPMHSSLRKIFDNAYSSTLRLQLALADYREFQFFSSDQTHYKDDPETGEWTFDKQHPGNLYVDDGLNACIDLEYDLISVPDRESFRVSKYYKKWFSFIDIVENKEVFSKLPVVIIDNKVIFDYKLYLDRGYIKIRLPFKSDFVYEKERNHEKDRLKYIERQITIQIIQNVFWTKSRVLKRNAVIADDLDRDNSIYKVSLSKSFSNELMFIYNKRYFPHIENRTGIYFAVFNFPDEKNSELGSFLCQMEIDGDTGNIKLDYDLKEKLFTYTGEFYVTLVWYQDLHKHKFPRYIEGENFNKYVDFDSIYCTGDKKGIKMAVIQKEEMVPYDMPIPVGNLMVVRTPIGSRTPSISKNDKTVELHYPNIYKFIDDEARAVGDKYELYYFYHEDTVYRFKYTPLTTFYHYYLKYHMRYNDDESLPPIECVINKIYLQTIAKLPLPQIISPSKIGLTHMGEYDTNMDDEQRTEFVEYFKKIFDYDFHEYIYGDVDFYHKYVSPVREDDNYPIEYKINKLREWIKDDQEYLRDYVANQKKLGTTYHLFTKNLYDNTDEDYNPSNPLSGFLRNDTLTEFPNKENYHEFKEPRYVFSLRNDNPSEELKCVVFVDGLMCMNLHQENDITNGITYLYIPAVMVTSDSYIEVEVRPTYSFKEEVTFTSLDDIKTIELLEPEEAVFPTIADLYIEEVDDGTIGPVSHRYDNTFFKVTAEFRKIVRPEYDIDVEVSTELNNPLVRFTRLTTFKIQPLKKLVLNKPLNIRFSKIAELIRVTMSESGVPYLSLARRQFKHHGEYIRIFREGYDKTGNRIVPNLSKYDYTDGRLLPNTKYSFLSSYDHPRLAIYDFFNKGEVITIDISPFRYKEVYYQDKLEPGITTIDLSPYITKPFDYRYYDVYMNGRKLSLPNIISVDAWSITLVNLFSTKNLQIFEKERDWEYFGLKYKDNGQSVYYFAKEDVLDSSYISEDERNKMLEKIISDRAKEKDFNIYPNTDNEGTLDYNDYSKTYMMLLFYQHELIPKTYINPDIYQTDEDLLEVEYPNVHETFMRENNDVKALLLDPDIYVSREGSETIDPSKGDKDNQIVCVVGHNQDMVSSDEDIAKFEEEMLSEKIKIMTDVNNIGGDL